MKDQSVELAQMILAIEKHRQDMSGAETAVWVILVRKAKEILSQE